MDNFQQFLIDQAEKAAGRPFNWENVKLVKECLHWNGPKVKLLTNDQYVAAYLLCDGYGTISQEFANDQDFDFSHVRDSSPIGFDRAAEYIRNLGVS
jgi:mannitol-1-phosphate/altronate dehydrogenase